MKRLTLEGRTLAVVRPAVVIGALLVGGLRTGDCWSAPAVNQGPPLEDLGAALLEEKRNEGGLSGDRRLLEPSGAVRGARLPKNRARLTQVVADMAEAGFLLEQLHASRRATIAQARALAGLDRLIAELGEKKSQCSGGQCDKPSSSGPGKESAGAGPAGETPGAASQSATLPAERFSQALGHAAELVRDLWGHLPERQREQILQPQSAEFLPQYAAEIEAYFRKLAEPE